MSDFDFLIGGECRHLTATRYPVFAKVDQSVVAEVPDASEADIDAAVSAARAAWPAWRRTPVEERARLLFRLADLMDAHAARIGEFYGPEAGWPRRGLVEGGMAFHSGLVRFYAGLAGRDCGSVLQDSSESLNYTVREPLGVIAHLLAWNTPLGAFTQKVPPALTAGNTVVVRAADEAPLTTLYLGRLVQEAGFPPGVINIVSGLGARTGEYLVAHPGVDGVSFTGSVAVGRAIAETAARSFKRTVLELGGKSPFVVFPDADLEHAAEAAVKFAFLYQGQGCTAVARVLVHESSVDEFAARVEALTRAYRPVQPEDWSGDAPHFGPLFNQRQFERMQRFVEIARRDGELLTGGERVTEAPFDRGFYVQPAVARLDDVRSPLWREEVFGPLFTVTPFRDEAHAVTLANDADFALSGSVWTRNSGRARRVARELRFGTVWTNAVFQFSHRSPWGGWKSTGCGREYGIAALDSFTEVKSIWINS